ncbi:MAG TPA: hypothetical protein VNV85_01425 [Puia sp.]|jgi:hypothetical protein|nr:hypothetical protein [Puia sp.]
MKTISFVVFMLFFIACKRGHSRSEVRDELSKAMLTFLWTDHKKDTSKIRFQIIDVSYFEDTTFYECEYKVRMHIIQTGFDTVGIMTARVAKDFSLVKRKQ